MTCTRWCRSNRPLPSRQPSRERNSSRIGSASGSWRCWRKSIQTGLTYTTACSESSSPGLRVVARNDKPKARNDRDGVIPRLILSSLGPSCHPLVHPVIPWSILSSLGPSCHPLVHPVIPGLTRDPVPRQHWIAGAETPDPGSSPGQALIRGRNDNSNIHSFCAQTKWALSFQRLNKRAILSRPGCITRPLSVIKAVTSSAGVTSKAGLRTCTPLAAH